MSATSAPLVLLASAPWETPAPVNVHQIARRMAARGRRVLFVESPGLRSPSPLRSGHDLRRVGARLRGWLRGPREVEPGLHVLSPLALPAGWPPPAPAVSRRWLARAVRRAARSLGFERPVAWCFLPTWLEAAEALDPRLLVYHCVDRYAANPGVDAAGVEAAERAMLERADRVLASSPELARHLGARRPDAVLLPNVADVAWFSRAVEESLPEPAELARLPRPRAVYAGNLAAYRIDFALLGEVARSLPEVQLVLIGAVGLGDTGAPPAAWEALRAEPNVHAVGAREQRALPDWLAHADAALVPFLDNEHTRASLPLKLWEYLAAGLPVVATALPQFEDLADEGLVRTASDAAAFAAALSAALTEPPEGRRARLAAARGHDWAARIDELERLIADAGDPAAVR